MLTYADVCNRAGEVGEAAHGGEASKSSTEPPPSRREYSLQQPGPFNSSGVTASVHTVQSERGRDGGGWGVGCGVWGVGEAECTMMNKQHDLEKTA
jgi:hypothetical protein